MLSLNQGKRETKFQISLLKGGIRMAMWAVAAVVVAHGLYNNKIVMKLLLANITSHNISPTRYVIGSILNKIQPGIILIQL